MKKNLIALLLAMSMVLSLAACGGSDDAAEDTTADAVTEETTGEVETDAENVVTELPETDPEAGTPAAPAEDPETTPSMPAVTPEATPTVKPETNTSASSVDLEAFYNELYEMLYPVDADGNATGPFVADLAAMPEMVEAYYPGLSAVSTKQLHIYVPQMTGVPYEVLLVEVSNAGDVDTVKAILQNRIDTEVENLTGYPAIRETWEQNARIVSNGCFVLLAATSGYESYVESFNALFA